MKVLMLTQTYPRFAGDTAGTFIRSLAETLAASGDEVHVLLPWDRALETPARSGGPYLHSFRYAPSDGLHVLGYSRTLQNDTGLRRLAWLLGPLYAAAARSALKDLARRVAPDVVNAHWLVPNAAAVAGAVRVPLVVSLHGSDVFMAERGLMRPFARRALRRAGALTGSSPELVDRAAAIHPPPYRRFIPYGVDPDLFDGRDPGATELRTRLGVPAHAVMVLAVGRVVEKKGFEVLLEALAHVQRDDWLAVVAGSGDSLDALRARAQSLGLGGRVRFPGAVAHSELPAWYSAADVFVMPSVHDRAGNVDGLPNVVLEAMASGKAIVGTRVGGIPAVILDGRTGLVVPQRDPEALAAALTRLVSSHAERVALGVAARNKVLEELTWPEIAARYREAYVAAGARP